MNRNWRWFLPGYAWALLGTLIGLLLCIFYRAHDFRWHQGVLTCVAPKSNVIGHPGAQTWGWLIIYTDPRYRTEPWGAELRTHEYTHVAQGFVLGPIFLLVYGLFFVVFYFTKQPDEQVGWHDDYMRNPFEKHAYRVGARHTADSWGA